MDINQDYPELLAQILEKKFPFEQAKLNMYHSDDIYYRIPSLIFRLKDINKYTEIEACIDCFKGILKWKLYRYMYSRKDNYVIAPYKLYEIERNFNEDIQNEKDMIPKDEYELICRNAIKDIPNLAEHIQIYFNI